MAAGPKADREPHKPIHLHVNSGKAASGTQGHINYLPLQAKRKQGLLQ